MSRPPTGRAVSGPADTTGATFVTVTVRPPSVPDPPALSATVTDTGKPPDAAPAGLSAYTWVALNVPPETVAGEVVPSPQVIVAVNDCWLSCGSVNVPEAVTDCPSETAAVVPPLTVNPVTVGATLPVVTVTGFDPALANVPSSSVTDAVIVWFRGARA